MHCARHGGTSATRSSGHHRLFGERRRMSMLAVHDLAVSYGNINAVQGVSFQVEPGELVALIGANGAGKSSTLNCLAGLLPAKRGDVKIQGQSLNRVPAFERVSHGMALV